MSELEFNKSSRCGDGACVEVAIDWEKSSFCGDSACVEAGTNEEVDVVYIRNTTEPDLVVAFPKAAWRGFINEVRDGTTLIESI